MEISCPVVLATWNRTVPPFVIIKWWVFRKITDLEVCVFVSFLTFVPLVWCTRFLPASLSSCDRTPLRGSQHSARACCPWGACSARVCTYCLLSVPGGFHCPRGQFDRRREYYNYFCFLLICSALSYKSYLLSFIFITLP